MLHDFQDFIFRNERGMRDTWKKLDRSGTKGITAADFKLGLHKMGIEIEAAAAEQLVRRFDRGGNGQLELTEFIKMMQSDADRF